MIVFGMHGSIMMQLARLGGHRSGRRIRPEEVDGYMQATKDIMIQDEVIKRKPPRSG